MLKITEIHSEFGNRGHKILNETNSQRISCSDQSTQIAELDTYLN